MLIQCLTEREGDTPININGFQYVFKHNDLGHSVCEVNSREHREWLLKTGNFKRYVRWPHGYDFDWRKEFSGKLEDE